jgi:hypothetical protein
MLLPCLPPKNLTVKIMVQRTTISSVVLYGCETWPLTLREEYRLMMFENKLLRRIFVIKREQVK